MKRRHFHRVVFLVAGLYNLAWGLYSVVDPQWLFRFARMPLQNYPQIFACLGMVVGLYGILYIEVARVPERGWLIAAVGLAGKILGPIGLGWLIWTGAWPARTGPRPHSLRQSLRSGMNGSETDIVRYGEGHACGTGVQSEMVSARTLDSGRIFRAGRSNLAGQWAGTARTGNSLLRPDQKGPYHLWLLQRWVDLGFDREIR